MSASDVEAHIELEARLVAYLQTLQPAGGPLDADLQIFPGHGDASLDNIPTLSIVYTERSDTQRYWQGGLEKVDVRMLVQTQGDDTNLCIHNARVAAYRAAFDLRNFNDRTVTIEGVPTLVQGFKTIINATPGFGLSGWGAGSPPLEDAFDKQKAQRQALFRFTAICGIELTG